MESSAQILLTLGGILLLGLATDILGQRTFLPRVTLMLLFGIAIGPAMLDLIPAVVADRFELIANMALLMVGFLLGSRLTRENLRRSGKEIISISVSAVLGTALLVFLGLVLAGVPVEIAILLGCIASATAPAATVDIVMESGYKGYFADLLLAVVALDDAWGLILFSLGLALVAALAGLDGHSAPMLVALQDIGGAALLGVFIGLPAAFLTGRIRPGQPMLVEALGLVFICGGIALWLDVSFLIASMVMGAVIANLARHHEYPFHAIEDIEWPFMVIFFVLAGALLEFSSLAEIGLIGAVYIGCRIVGKVVGAGIGGRYSRSGDTISGWIGLAMLPQAGAAMGMALVAINLLPEYRQVVLSVVISTTVFFELIGPPFTRLALQRTANNIKGGEGNKN
ncbi:MAG: cation:proton antiporter [Gammaproteobacteria bacterium]|nr:cation:proton antiporter [Gammaproteobacteria bacterium]